MKNKILVVKFNSAHPTYGFSSIKPGVANVESIEFAHDGIIVKRKGGQVLWHPMTSVSQIEIEESEQAASPAKKTKE